ncbi:hypothetical protein D1BOALGB6SA_7378 [Olavius sp. associated proteobacterium Delta 1]|nr:hypothetical protein D1BOALGB6SA_7378 [Olavius sp. associated proteobacterium Delta 1]
MYNYAASTQSLVQGSLRQETHDFTTDRENIQHLEYMR